MITIREAEEILKKEYHRDNFLYLVDEILLPDFKADKHPVIFQNDIFVSVTQLGISTKCDITIYEVVLKAGAEKRRVAITQQMFRILRGQGINNALVAFANADKNNYRISLLTSKYEFDGDKVVKVISNPRRFSYSLGFGTKTKTAYKFLIEKGKVNSLEELTSRFSVEVVNKQFYSEIATCFTELVGGERDGHHYNRLLDLYGVTNNNKFSEFAVRLIGRIVFCWFLREKKSVNGLPLLPESLMSLSGITENYYHTVLEPLFFELLNTSGSRRKDKYGTEVIYKQIPYLNGGLFNPHVDDHYKYDKTIQCGKFGLVTIPDEWFRHFYGVLSQYNFTVDENTAYDIELSIDPEMLGRIFENLLAEINPETGENAKKSTGSFYTPRDIVDYMVDNSILEYLKTKTSIDETRLKALISYSKEDDDLASFDNEQKKLIIDALYSVTILDPACGSGAFPIGMMQKIVYIMQQVDPEANLLFDKATENVGILWKKEFEKQFTTGALDYLRKLSVIQNSIFGVDIQPIAVEIARLRCFLSLVIEEKVVDEEENRGIKPLPSLDFKFIIANTLVPLDDNDQMSLLENQDYIKELKNVRDEYFNAEPDRKAELKLEFAEIQKRMYQDTIDNYSKQASRRYAELSRWSPFANDSTSWFDPEWMFGIKDGFDIVIGNPPYIDYRKIDEYTKNSLNRFKSYRLSKMASIFVYFIEVGSIMLKREGILTYINPYQYFSSKAGFGLRNYICTEFPLLKVIDLSDIRVFDEASAYTCINFFRKTVRPHDIKYFKPENLVALETNGALIAYSDIISNKEREIVINRNPIINKLDQLSLFVGEYAQICVGSSYGGFRKHVSKIQKEGYMPLVESSDVQKFIFTSRTYVDKTIYPLELRQRFENNKALYMARMTKDLRVALGLPGYYLGKVNYITSTNDNVLYGLLFILNSNLVTYYYRIKNESKHLSGGYLGMDIPSVKTIPLPRTFVTFDWKQLFEKAYEQRRQDAITSKTLDEINRVIYHIYGLTEEEIAIVEKSIG